MECSSEVFVLLLLLGLYLGEVMDKPSIIDRCERGVWGCLSVCESVNHPEQLVVVVVIMDK